MRSIRSSAASCPPTASRQAKNADWLRHRWACCRASRAACRAQAAAGRLRRAVSRTWAKTCVGSMAMLSLLSPAPRASGATGRRPPAAILKVVGVWTPWELGLFQAVASRGRGQCQAIRIVLDLHAHPFFHGQGQPAASSNTHAWEYRNVKRYLATVLGDRGHGEASSPTAAAARTTRSRGSGEVARTACFLCCPV